jgi:GT2 family glycosyltransferase
MRGRKASLLVGMGSTPVQPAVSIVVVTYMRPDLLEACLRSLAPARERLRESSELIVVDNGSPADVGKLVHAFGPDATVVELEENIGFSAAVGEGIREAEGEWLALFNDDTTLEPEALRQLYDAAQDDRSVGSVAAQMRFAKRPDLINSAGIELDRLGVASDRKLGQETDGPEAATCEVFGVSGGAALYRRSALEEVGGFDPTFFAYLEDVDLAWRLRMRGWRSLYAPRAVVLHHHSATLIHQSDEKYFRAGRNRVRLLAKNADRRLLLRYGLPMALYDLGYVMFALFRDRTLAPLRGRIRGLREWRTYRSAGRPYRRPVPLLPPRGPRSALRRRAVWTDSSSFGPKTLEARGTGSEREQLDRAS